MLAEMDEEFGVGDIISEVTREEKKKVSSIVCMCVHVL